MANECEGKATYETMASALRVAKAVNQRKYLKSRNHNKGPAHPYKCEFCGKYHLTGQKRNRIT